MSNVTKDDYLDHFQLAVLELLADPSFHYRYDRIVDCLHNTKVRGGRVFIVGMGGSAANAQHLANDLRKMCHIDAICLSDNIAELTARANDDGWASIYVESLKISGFRNTDILFVLSVSGGLDTPVVASAPLVNVVKWAAAYGTVVGIVGMCFSVTETFGDHVIVTPYTKEYLTQIAEALQGVIWHGMISDPRLMAIPAKW